MSLPAITNHDLAKLSDKTKLYIPERESGNFLSSREL
jgi:hypothetical protein